MWSTPEGCVKSNVIRCSFKKGIKLKPKGVWDEEIELEIKGVPDANYATVMDSRKSVRGFSVFLNEAPMSFKSYRLPRRSYLPLPNARKKCFLRCM
jgi:hypothetical protein